MLDAHSPPALNCVCVLQVTAVDRAELHPQLMRDDKVSFIKGDAFSYLPSSQVDWMVSDVIADPSRVPALLEAWCTGRWARRLVVTMKFKGTPDWGQLAKAQEVADEAQYAMRAKHFFNNKNEVTLMLAQLPSRNQHSAE